MTPKSGCFSYSTSLGSTDGMRTDAALSKRPSDVRASTVIVSTPKSDGLSNVTFEAPRPDTSWTTYPFLRHVNVISVSGTEEPSPRLRRGIASSESVVPAEGRARHDNRRSAYVGRSL